MGILPDRRSRGWFFWMLCYGILLTLLLWLNRYIVEGSDFTIPIALRFVLLAFVLSLVVNGFGWLGARWVWLMTTLGTIFGLGLMFYYTSKDMSGWEDLASFLGFIEGVVIGFGVGLLIEGVRLVLKLRKG